MDFSELGVIKQYTNEVKLDNFINILKLKALLIKWSKYDIPIDPQLPVKSTNLSEICLAYKEVQVYPGLFTQTEKDFITTFCKQLAKKVQDNYATSQESTIVNNFQSHRIKMLASAAAALNDTVMMSLAEKWLFEHLDNNLLAGGLCLDFKDRDSVKYVSYNLEPLLVANGLILRLLKRNHFWKKNKIGVSLKDAVRWMQPYIFGTKTNIMLINSIYASDSNNPDYNKKWMRSFANNVINLAIQFDSEFIRYFG